MHPVENVGRSVTQPVYPDRQPLKEPHFVQEHSTIYLESWDLTRQKNERGWFLKATTKRPTGNNRIKISFSSIYFITFITINKKILKKRVRGFVEALNLWGPRGSRPGCPVLNPALMVMLVLARMLIFRTLVKRSTVHNNGDGDVNVRNDVKRSRKCLVL
jgi:hypothetical protein